MKSDFLLRQDVVDELTSDPSFDSDNIAVSAKDGVITLSGIVPNFADKYAAERAAFRVSGVKAVADEIEVKLSKENIRSDQEIAKAAADAVQWHVNIPKSVHISVEDGVIILRGEVEWEYQRDAANLAMRSLTGVKQIKNHLSIRHRPQPKDVAARIQNALVRSAKVDAKKVHVATADGKVILTGKVRSQAEANDAKWAAWAIPGVTTVESHLTVD